jgi:hypothetical protein
MGEQTHSIVLLTKHVASAEIHIALDQDISRDLLFRSSLVSVVSLKCFTSIRPIGWICIKQQFSCLPSFNLQLLANKSGSTNPHAQAIWSPFKFLRNRINFNDNRRLPGKQLQ